MSVRLSSVVLMVITGCSQPSEPPLSRLTQAWAVDTAEHASMPVTSTLLLGALASEFCVDRSSEASEIPEPGSPLALSEPLKWALGDPMIHSVEVDSEPWSTMTLTAMDLLGLSGQWLRIQVDEQEGELQFEFSPLLDEEGVVDEPARLVGFGQTTLSVQADCMEEKTVVSGTALWIDVDGRRHELKLPADQELGSDIVFAANAPWIPTSGGMSWEARIDGQRRSISTSDADELRMSSASVGRWPAVVHGPDWSGSAMITISP